MAVHLVNNSSFCMDVLCLKKKSFFELVLQLLRQSSREKGRSQLSVEIMFSLHISFRGVI